MRQCAGQVLETRLDAVGAASAWVSCPAEAVPSPGQYVLAWSPDDVQAPLPTTLFAAETSEQGFLAVPPLPPCWQPGTLLELRGPLGHGFNLPTSIRRLALAALGNTQARLLPLIPASLVQDVAVALFTDQPLPFAPAALEIYPVQDLPGAIAWADFLALDLPASKLDRLRQELGVKPGDFLPCPAQALILIDMPCGGLADCGICALPAHRKWKLACKDGPVFDLHTLEW
jgi:hypothetical protein